MLDLKYVAQNFDAVVARLKTRGGNLDLGPFQKLFTERRELYVAMEALSARRNTANEEMKKKAKEDPAALEALRGELRAVSQEIKEKEARLKEVEEELNRILLLIPNVPHESVPVGAGEHDNQVRAPGARSRTSSSRPSSTSRSARSWACWTSSAPPRCPAPLRLLQGRRWRGWSGRWSPS